MGVVITGLGGAVPANPLSNEDISRRLETSPEWIATRTGIYQRFHAKEGTTTSGLAVNASRNAIATNCTDGTIDMVLLATTTPDRQCPATAPKVASQLGLGAVSAADISAVCSGFLYALQFGTAAIRSGMSKKVLIIGVDVFSSILDPSDRSTFPIFGDGAGAMIIEAGEGDDIIDIETGSDGRFEDLITIRGGGVEAKFSDLTEDVQDEFFRMEGKTVFTMAVENMSRSVEHILKKNGFTAREVDHVIAHQANSRIIATVADQLNIPIEKVVISLNKFGNTSAASIPLALCDGAERMLFRPGDLLSFTAFGGGLTWGAALARWPKLGEIPAVSQT